MKNWNQNKEKTLNPNLKDEIKGSHVDHTWALIVGIVKDDNSLNSANVKLVKVLNICNVVHFLAKTFWTLIIECMDCPTPSSITWCELKKNPENSKQPPSNEKILCALGLFLPIYPHHLKYR